ncbi:MAG: TonB-dependent receptor [Bacteroidota bacterium]
MFAQNSSEKFTISGYVKEESTGEFLLGANVYIKENKKGTTTNQYGFYSLTLEKGDYTLVISFIGYEDFTQAIKLDKDLRINVSMKEAAATTQEIEVKADSPDKNVESTQMGTFSIEVDRIKKLPAFMGEVDILKTIQLIPGVQSAGEGNSGFYVRGGGPDQNLILLDEAVVYNASHLFGFFSVFNADAVKNVNLIKGGMPAQYGGRLSSVLDINMKEGNNQKYEVEGGIGLISSRLTIQGPIKKDTSSFIVSARRTYIDVLVKPFIPDSKPAKGSGYYFYDLNTKLNYRLSDKDRLFLSGYFGRDVFDFRSNRTEFKSFVIWGNATGCLRWNHLFNDKLFVNTSAIFSDYKFEFGAVQDQFEFKLFSGIRDWNGKVDFSYFPNLKHNIKFGVNYIYHTFTPSGASARSGDVEFDLGEIVKLYAHDAAVYINDDYKITDLFAVNLGLRYSYFMHVGPFDRYVKDNFGNITDTIVYKKGDRISDYDGLEPRFSFRYTLDENSSIKGAYTQNFQYIHLASISAVSLPTDVWFPSTSIVKPQFSTQYALGYFRNFKEGMYETSVEVYYKDMRNLIEYKEGAQPEDGVKDNPDYSFTFGKGWSYGAEFFVKKSYGKLNGWVGYTLAWTERQFKDLNKGEVFPAKYDRRHDVSVVLTYDLSEKWSFSAIFIYATGNAATLPIGRYMMEGWIVNEYGERNSYRLAAYHRMDLSATYTPDRSKKLARRKKRLEEKYAKQGKDPSTVEVPKRWARNYESSWNFSVFNVYNRMNPYYIYFDTEGDFSTGSMSVKAYQVSLFPVLPSVTWNFKF